MIPTIDMAVQDLALHHDPYYAGRVTRFFKVGPGSYSEHDQFVGITVPILRRLAKKYHALSHTDIETLLRSPLHEYRLLAILIMVHNFNRASAINQDAIYRLYCNNISFINNWDLVDQSAAPIIGGFLANKPEKINTLETLARSKNLWERRMAIVATFYWIKLKSGHEALHISRLLLQDPHDLIHKAAGWMLREVGKRCSKDLLDEFIVTHHREMPRIMLRYALERHTKEEQSRFYARNI